VYVGSSHWYLAIICFPYLVGEKQMTGSSESDPAAAKSQLKQVALNACFYCEHRSCKSEPAVSKAGLKD